MTGEGRVQAEHHAEQGIASQIPAAHQSKAWRTVQYSIVQYSAVLPRLPLPNAGPDVPEKVWEVVRDMIAQQLW